MMSVIRAPRRLMGEHRWLDFIIVSFNEGIPGVAKVSKDFNLRLLEVTDIDNKLEAYVVAYLLSMVIANSASVWSTRRKNMNKHMKAKAGDGAIYFLVPDATIQDFATADSIVADDRAWFENAEEEHEVEDDLHEVFSVGEGSVLHLSPKDTMTRALAFSVDDV